MFRWPLKKDFFVVSFIFFSIICLVYLSAYLFPILSIALLLWTVSSYFYKIRTMTLFSLHRLAAAAPAAVYACSSYASSCCRAGRWCSRTDHKGTGIPGVWHACASADRLIIRDEAGYLA